MVEKIIYINLEKCVKKRKTMEGRLNKLNVPYERFDAVAPTAETIEKGGIHHYVFDKISPNLQNAMADGKHGEEKILHIVGCYLSHLKVHVYAEKCKFENYLVLEDDCHIIRDTINVLNSNEFLSKLPENWDLFRACWESNPIKMEYFDKNSPYSKFSSKYDSDFYVKKKMMGGSHITLVNKKTIKKILQYFEEEYFMEYDSLITTNRLNVYHMKLPGVWAQEQK